MTTAHVRITSNVNTDSTQKGIVLASHRSIVFVLAAQVALTAAIGIFTNTLAFGLITAVVIAIPAILLVWNQPDSSMTKHTVAAATQLIAALNIQQTAGMTEMHFQVFVLLAFLSYYKDWKVIVTGTLVIAIHHIAGFIVQNMGGGLTVFEDNSPGFLLLVIHAAFAILECAVLATMAFNAQRQEQRMRAFEYHVKNIVRSDGSLIISQQTLDECESLDELHLLLSRVRQLVSQSSHVCGSLVQFTGKVKSSADLLEQSMNSQNMQVESISSAINEMTHSIASVAQMGQEVHRFSTETERQTGDAQQVIDQSRQQIAQLQSRLHQTSNDMQDLSNKCQNIAQVMVSIKSVAEQTNLLALNAAIESARAGEHGRGFAVVADEVRNLAIKSKESAEEIEAITSSLVLASEKSVTNMNDCISVVADAVQASETADHNMSEALQGIAHVSNNMTSVKTALDEQSNVSMSINQSTQELHSLIANDQSQFHQLQADVQHLDSEVNTLLQQMAKFAVS